MKIKEHHIDQFHKHVSGLDKLMKEIRQYCPEANLYVAMDELNLMQGTTHNDNYKPLHENIVCTVRIDSLDGGDW